MAKKHISKTRCSNTEEEEHYILSSIIYVATFSFNNICISSSVGGVVQNFLAKDGSKAIRCMMRWKEKAIKPAF